MVGRREGSNASPEALLLLFSWFQPIPRLKATTHSYTHHVPILLSPVFRAGCVFISVYAIQSCSYPVMKFWMQLWKWKSALGQMMASPLSLSFFLSVFPRGDWAALTVETLRNFDSFTSSEMHISPAQNVRANEIMSVPGSEGLTSAINLPVLWHNRTTHCLGWGRNPHSVL